jgi:hypothetical protein
MRLQLSSLKERIRASLFFIPMLAVIGAIAFGLVALGLDRHLDPATNLPLGFTSVTSKADSSSPWPTSSARTSRPSLTTPPLDELHQHLGGTDGPSRRCRRG